MPRGPRHKDEDFYQVMDLADKGVADVDIEEVTGFNLGWIGGVTRKYWIDKMKIQQVDDYLKQKFPDGSVKQASLVCGVSEQFIKRRILYLNLDADLIFEIIKTK